MATKAEQILAALGGAGNIARSEPCADPAADRGAPTRHSSTRRP